MKNFFLFLFLILFVACNENDTKEELLIARANLNKGAFETTRYHLDQVLRVDSVNIEAIMLYGRLEKELKNYKEALNKFNQVLEINYDYVAAYRERAIVLLNLGLPEKAIADYSRLIAIYSDDGNIFLERGNVYFELNKMDLACQDWKQAAELGVGDANRIIEKFCQDAELEQQ